MSEDLLDITHYRSRRCYESQCQPMPTTSAILMKFVPETLFRARPAVPSPQQGRFWTRPSLRALLCRKDGSGDTVHNSLLPNEAAHRRATYRSPSTKRSAESLSRRSDDTEACRSQCEQATVRVRLQASSCRPAMMDVISLAGRLRHSIETGDQNHATLAFQWDKTKDEAPLEKRFGRRHENRRQVWWLSPDD